MTRETLSQKQTRTLKKIIVFFLIFVLILLVIFSSMAVGMGSALRQDNLFYFVKNIKRKLVTHVVTTETENHNFYGQLVSHALKTKIPPTIVTEKTIVAFVFGQSNSANHTGERYQGINENVVNYYNGDYYIASDPLLGATGIAGSMWTLTANKLVQNNVAEKVILIPAGVGGTSIKHWQYGGKLNGMLENRLKDAQNNHLVITHFLWHQGEADYGISDTDYSKGLTEVIELTQRYFPHSKFFVSQASRCGDIPSYDPVLRAQRDITRLKNVYAGPNTDLIDDRYDACHLSGKGVEKASEQWIELIRNPRKAQQSAIN